MSEDAHEYEEIKIFGEAGEKTLEAPGGSSFTLNSATNYEATITAKNADTGQTITLYIGQPHRMNFRKLILTSDAAVSITILVGVNGSIVAGRSDTPGLENTVSNSAPLSKPGAGGTGLTDISILDGEQKKVLDSNANRRHAEIYRVDTTTGMVRFDHGTSLPASQGGALWPKGAKPIYTTDEVWVRNDSGATVVIGRREIDKVS